MTINLRVNEVSETHARCTLFMNGAKCGDLAFRIGEYQLFGAVISLGTKHAGQFTVINTSDDSVFIEWLAKEKIKHLEENKK